MNDTTRLRHPWLDGRVQPMGGDRYELRSPWDGKVVAEVEKSDPQTVARAVDSSHQAFESHRTVPAATRVDWLRAAAAEIDEIQEDLIGAMIAAIGKPRRSSQFEASRVRDLIMMCASEIGHMSGEVLPLDAVQRGAGRIGLTRRVPYGVIAAVTPFNAPANLLMQKVAPALAMGNAVVVKPSSEGAEVALLLAQAFSRAGLPNGLFNVVPGDRTTALSLVAQPMVRLVTLTGGVAAGDSIAQAAGAKPLLLELGSSAPNIICADADIDDAAHRLVAASFEASGQQCISAQRIIVEEPVVDQFVKLFVEAAQQLQIGDPNSADTQIGPMVNEESAKRVERLVEDAVERGAHLALAPTRDGAVLSPGIVVDAPPEARIMREEAFGPVVVVIRADSVADAIRVANESDFGLQGSCFTTSLNTAFRVSDELDIGCVWINEASRFRLDTYPFGGVRSSGFGREGVRYAMEELSQWKFTGIRFPQGPKPA